MKRKWKRKWGRALGIVAACSLLAGCGSPAGGAAQGEPTGAAQDESVGTVQAVQTGTVQGELTRTALDETAEPEEPVQTPQSGGWDREDADSVETLQDFSWQLMLRNMEQENPVLSPVSAYLALGMVGMGAQEETEREFQEVLGANMLALSRSLMERYPQEQEGMVLTIANSVWVDEELTPGEQWMVDVQEIFRGESYRGVLSSGEIMEQINDWCSENTRGLIPQMLEEPMDVHTRLALLDAVYFKGDWQIPFAAENTMRWTFTREDGTELQADTMSMMMEEQRYLCSSLGEGVVLPYQGGEFAYVAILPREGTEVRELYRQLTPQALAELLGSESRVLCNLRLPKYEVSFDRELNESLRDMGLVSAFDELADFSGLGATRRGGPLYIDLVRQKAVFRVDEKGTEAAAVTMVMARDCAMLIDPEPLELYFDRPFVYMILDMETQIPLFVGILDDPE